MYISLADTKTLIARILAPYEQSGIVEDSHLQLIIDEAEAIVNSAICSRYDIPVVGTNAVNYLKSLIVPIIRFKTCAQYSSDLDIPAGIMEDYKLTLKSLDMLAKQVTSIPSVTDKVTGRAASIKISTITSPIEGF